MCVKGKGDLKAINRYLQSSECTRKCLPYYTHLCRRTHCIRPMSCCPSRKLVCHVALLANDKSDKRSTGAVFRLKESANRWDSIKTLLTKKQHFLCISQPFRSCIRHPQIKFHLKPHRFCQKWNLLASEYMLLNIQLSTNITHHMCISHQMLLLYPCLFWNICHRDSIRGALIT